MALRELVQSGLGRRVRLAAVRRPQKLWRESGTLGDAAVTELDHVRDREEADHVHQHLESEPCGQPPRTSTRSDAVCGEDVFKVLRTPPSRVACADL